MENARGDVTVERIPSAFFREALDLALEAVKARRLRRVAEQASPSRRTSNRRRGSARLPKK